MWWLVAPSPYRGLTGETVPTNKLTQARSYRRVEPHNGQGDRIGSGKGPFGIDIRGSFVLTTTCRDRCGGTPASTAEAATDLGNYASV
jgi:hypothetical protein